MLTFLYRIFLTIDGLVIVRRIKRRFSKVQYLLHSFFLSIRDDGFLSSVVRVKNFILYGKGSLHSSDTFQGDDKDLKKMISLDSALPFLRFDESDQHITHSRMIDIVIPVYNGFDFLEPLFDSVVRNTKVEYRLVIAEDASTDDRVRPFLKAFCAENPQVETVLLLASENRGFVVNVNEAYKHVNHDFVLLNTDTEVPEGWLERLLYPLAQDEKVASATPFTNSGEIFSFPRIDYVPGEQKLISGTSLADIDLVLERYVRAETFATVPTGMGYCMVFRKSVVDEIGFFDAEAFGRGYGEETDWCQRAVSHGYRHVLVPNLFVYHKHGASFPSEEKKVLLEKHLRILNKRYPHYHKDVQTYFMQDTLRPLRELLYALILTKKSLRTSLLFDHAFGGGANIFSDRLRLQKVSDGESMIFVRYDTACFFYRVEVWTQQENFSFVISDFPSLKKILSLFRFYEIFVNELVAYENIFATLLMIADLKSYNDAKVTHYMHDFFAICPNFTLINEQSQYCGVPSLPTELSACMRCLRHTKTNYALYTPEKNVIVWREKWQNFLSHTANEIVCFSESSKDILLRAYPDLRDKTTILPHSIAYTDQFKKVQFQKSEKKKSSVKVGILGSINYVKGADVLNVLLQLTANYSRSVSFVIIGEASGIKKDDRISVHGRFKLVDIPEIAAKEHIDLFIIPSIWPETFSYTTSEVIALGYPLVVFDIGAQAERVKTYEKGFVASEITAQALWDEMQQVLTASE